jgi:uncharacterized protein (UPF0335 family)
LSLNLGILVRTEGSLRMADQEIIDKLNDIIARLERIEKRQVTIKDEVDEVEKKTPVKGSFGTTDTRKQQ